MIDFELTSRAKRDIAAARRWYDQKGVQVGDRFLKAVDGAILLARRQPEVLRASPRGVRGIMLRRFPYRMYYRVVSNRVRVVALYHASRDPDLWDDPNRR